MQLTVLTASAYVTREHKASRQPERSLQVLLPNTLHDVRTCTWQEALIVIVYCTNRPFNANMLGHSAGFVCCCDVHSVKVHTTKTCNALSQVPPCTTTLSKASGF